MSRRRDVLHAAFSFRFRRPEPGSARPRAAYLIKNLAGAAGAVGQTGDGAAEDG